MPPPPKLALPACAAPLQGLAERARVPEKMARSKRQLCLVSSAMPFRNWTEWRWMSRKEREAAHGAEQGVRGVQQGRAERAQHPCPARRPCPASMGLDPCFDLGAALWYLPRQRRPPAAGLSCAGTRLACLDHACPDQVCPAQVCLAKPVCTAPAWKGRTASSTKELLWIYFPSDAPS